MTLNIGDSYGGGYYAGIIDTTVGNIIEADASQVGQRYALIVAPYSTEAIKAYSTGAAPPSAAETRWDGQTATAAMNSGSYPAAQYCAGLTYPSDGGSPWYLPALDELELLYRNLKPTTDSNAGGSTSGTTFPGGTHGAGYNPSSSPTGATYTSAVPAQTTVALFKSGGAQALASGGDPDYVTVTADGAAYFWNQNFAPSGTGNQTVLGIAGANVVRAVRRISLDTAPSQPTLTSPTSGQVLDATDGVPFELTYHATDGQDCNAYTLRLKAGTGSYSYWDAATSSWSASEVWNTLGTPVADGGTISVTVPTSASLENGNSYNWSGNTQESGDDLQGTYAPDSAFTAQDPPAVDITAPVDGVTIASTNTPTATWTAVLAPGSSQTAYRVVWESGSYGTTPGSGTPAADTGVVSSAAGSVTCPTALAIGTTYRMFVQLTETGGETSLWEYVTNLISLTPPSIPTLTATPAVDGTTGLPTVAVAANVADTGSWDRTNTTVQVQMSSDGGSTWLPVRDAATGVLATSVALDDSGDATVIDGEAPFGVDTLYRADATGSADGGMIVTAWSSTATATLDVSRCWLVDPLDLSTALAVPVSVDDTRTRTITQDVTATLGSSMPVISSDARQAEIGTFTWICPDKATRDALETLLTNGRTLLQRTAAEVDGDPGVHVYFRPVGDITVDRLAQTPISPRLVKTGWAQRARPS